MKPINFKTIPHKDHRYPTVGDYWETDDAIEVRVSGMCDQFEQLVLIHELIEIFLLKNKGVTLAVTDEFDIMFERERAEGAHSPVAEPGDDPRCPYKNEHRFAENIERQLALAFGVDWEEYNKFVMNL